MKQRSTFDCIHDKVEGRADSTARKMTVRHRTVAPRGQERIRNAAAQRRIVSKARIRLDSRKSARSFKAIICVHISEFESCMPSHAVGLRAGTNALTRTQRPSGLHAYSCADAKMNFLQL